MVGIGLCEVVWGAVYQCWGVEGFTVCGVHALLIYYLSPPQKKKRVRTTAWKSSSD
jgi:hypothetical protein